MVEMHRLREAELVFEFTGALQATVFDDKEKHGLSHCMKSVDFVVEYPDYYLYVEVKDPDNSQALAERRATFGTKLSSGALMSDVVRKYRDTWLYRWAEQRDAKPVRYVLLLQFSTLTPVMLLTLTDRLRQALPVVGPQTWTRSFVAHAAVLDMNQWNAIGSHGTVRRVPQPPPA
jgi:hypothetical protein